MKAILNSRALTRGIALALLCVLMLGLFAGCSQKETTPTDSQATGETPDTTGANDPAAARELTEREKEIAKNAVYNVADLSNDDSRLDEVVATCGDLKMTNRLFQIYYYMQYFGFMNQYGAYASYFGLDTSKPLSEQTEPQSGLTWEQSFVNAAFDQFEQFGAVHAKAIAEGYQITDQEKEQMESALSGLESEATSNGFASVDEYVQASFGPGVNQADYEEYLRSYFMVMSYENKMYNDIKWTDEDLLKYFQDNASKYNGVTTEQKNVNVRHILIQPEKTDDAASATEDTSAETGAADTKLTAEQAKAAAKAKAEEILAEYEQNPSEDNFAALAEKYSSDPGSNTKGGLYEDVYPGQMVPAFNDWCFDASRKTGDTGIVETDYGYHVMYFVDQTDNYYWKTLAEKDYPASVMDDMLKQIVDGSELQADYSAIVLGSLPEPKESDK